MKKDNKQDPALRAAIYCCYNEKDAYTHQPLTYEDMEIDHIIPISLKRTPERLTSLLEEIGLTKDFELDSIENYLPTHKQTNRQKSDLAFSSHTARYYLELAKTAAPRIREAMADFKLKKKLDSSVENIKSSVYHGLLDPENLYNTLSEDDEDFQESRFIIRDDPYYVYSYSKKNVKINANLPLYSLNMWEGNCILTFRSLKIRDSTLTLTHHDLVTYLFEGLFTDSHLQQRGFIVGKHPEQDFYFVQIGNSQFPLDRTVLHQLCEIIDDFAIEYIKAFQELESLIEAIGFKRSRTLNRGYRLLEVNLSLWRSMVEFASKHDFEKGDTPWHMFDRNNFMIKVYTRCEGGRYDEGYHVFLNGELRGEHLFLEPVDNLWIVWEPAVELDNGGAIEETVNERQTWGVLTTHNWLVNEFIPAVLDYMCKKQHLNTQEIKDLILTDGYALPPRIEDIQILSELHDLVFSMQRFFNRPRKFLIERAELASLYQALMMCLRKTKMVDLHYVTMRAGVREHITNMKGLLKGIERKSQNIEENELRNYHMVDNLFRALYVTFEKKPNLDHSEIREVIHYLRPFYDKMIQLETIDRMKNDFED